MHGVDVAACVRVVDGSVLLSARPHVLLAMLGTSQAARAAADKAAVKTEYETVPGFYQRRGWHGSAINEHNYAEHWRADNAVFPAVALKPGAMAKFLERPVDSNAGNPQEPRGRARRRRWGRRMR